jgi:hypothetical protein
MLKIDGKRLMEVTHETPGPKIGYTLSALLEEVLEDPKLNTAEYLEKRATGTHKNAGKRAKSPWGTREKREKGT